MKILLAPMEGVVDPVIRELFSKIGGFDQMCTEFIRVTDKLNPPKVFYKYCPELKNNGLTKYGTPVYVQLLGGQPGPLSENASLAVQLGAPGIDLNFGCPAKTVNRHDGGAAILKQPSRLFDIITQVKKATSNAVPVTAKIRLGFDDKSLVHEIAHCLKEAAPTSVTVHARTKAEGYAPPAHWHYIAKIKSIISPLPIVANGDIWDTSDYHKCVKESLCTDVALGRGAYANPFLAQAIKANLTLSPAASWGEFRTNIIPKFIDLSEELVNPSYALRRTKQWVKFLSRNYKLAHADFETIKTIKDLKDLNNHFKK